MSDERKSIDIADQLRKDSSPDEAVQARLIEAAKAGDPDGIRRAIAEGGIFI